MRKQHFLLITIALLLPFCAGAQARKLVAEGNKQYQQKNYQAASTDYLRALNQDSTSTAGMFNLGNALYQQKQYDAARKVLDNTARQSTDKYSKAQANYNIGNTYMAEQKWEDAASAYKQTLRNNPQDGDAKYNLAYAESMMRKQQQQNKDQKNKDQKQDQKNKQQQNKDQQNKDQKNKDQQKQKQDQGKQGDDKDQQHPQPQPSKLSQQQADQLLNALAQEEKKLQDKEKKEKGVPVKMQKDW